MPSIPGLISLFNAQNPGMSQRVNPSLINLGNIGQNPSGMPTLPMLEDYNAEPDLTRANAAEKAAYEMKPTQVRSNIGTKDILALLLAGLAGSEGGNVLKGYMQGKQAAQAQREALAAQKYQQAQQQQLQEAASIRAGIPIKQSQIAKLNEAKLKQFQTQADIYNKGQSDLTKRDLAGETNKRILSVAEIESQDRRIKANTDALMKLPVESRAPWARENLGVTDPEILSSLGNLTPQNKKDIAAAKLSDAKRTTEDNLRQYRVDTFTSKIGLTKEQAKYLAAKTLALPAREAAIVAHLKKQDQSINAQMTNLTRLANYRDKLLNQKDRQMADANLRAATQSFDKSVTSAQQAVNGARSRLNALQKEYDIEPEKNADGSINPDRAVLQAQLKDASKFYADMVAESDKVVKKAQNLKKSLNPKAEMAAQIEGEIANKFGPGDGVRVAPVATDLGIPPAPGKSDVSMGNVNQSASNTGIPPKTKSKPTATPPKGKTVKIPSGFKRIQ